MKRRHDRRYPLYDCETCKDNLLVVKKLNEVKIGKKQIYNTDAVPGSSRSNESVVETRAENVADVNQNPGSSRSDQSAVETRRENVFDKSQLSEQNLSRVKELSMELLK